MLRLVVLVVLAASVALTTASVRGDELADAKKGLEALGVRVLTGGVLLASELDLPKELNKANGLRKALIEATKALETSQQLEVKGEQALVDLRKQHVVLSAQLAANNPMNVARNNQLVGALQAIEGQRDLTQKSIDELEERTRAARVKANEAREAYIQFTLDARKLADQVTADYETKAASAEMIAALEAYNKAAGKQFKLAPTPSFAAATRRLTQIEETILSESIPLMGEGRNVARVIVVIGKHQVEMVVDSGASSITLPYAMAEKMGLKPSESDPRLMMTLADGSQIEGRRKIIPSVRVGKFAVEKVECAVLSEEAVNAEPLLGMSFLGNFKFEVDSDAKTLTMVKIAGAEGKASK
ncbi:MAG: retroviral-like aspartic protease family protein [Planctomycetaceae bacterium]|nr:retroviral-like aspartic protease family protein [Planctomycetaceae bacterium]